MLRLVLYASICDKGHFGSKFKRDCRIAVSDQSLDRLKTKFQTGLICRNSQKNNYEYIYMYSSGGKNVYLQKDEKKK